MKNLSARRSKAPSMVKIKPSATYVSHKGLSNKNKRIAGGTVPADKQVKTYLIV